MAARPKKETIRHKEALAYYIGLGARRTLTAVAAKFSRSVQAVVKWSQTFEWQRRVREADETAGAKIIQKATDSLAEVKDRQIKITRLIQGKLVKRLQADEIEPTVADGLGAMRHELTLYGQSGELPKDLSANPVTESDADTIILEETRRLTAIRARRGR